LVGAKNKKEKKQGRYRLGKICVRQGVPTHPKPDGEVEGNENNDREGSSSEEKQEGKKVQCVSRQRATTQGDDWIGILSR